MLIGLKHLIKQNPQKRFCSTTPSWKRFKKEFGIYRPVLIHSQADKRVGIDGTGNQKLALMGLVETTPTVKMTRDVPMTRFRLSVPSEMDVVDYEPENEKQYFDIVVCDVKNQNIVNSEVQKGSFVYLEGDLLISNSIVNEKHETRVEVIVKKDNIVSLYE